LALKRRGEMRRKVSLVATLVVLVVMGVQPVLAITWGEPDTAHENVGAIIVDYPGWGWTPFCSGTLVGERVFLTAGHCTAALDSMGYKPEDGDVWVSFDAVPAGLGTGDDGPPPPDPSWIQVVEMITHPEYGPAMSNPRDVGALVLAAPVTDIEPATLPVEGFLNQLKTEGKLRQGSNGANFTVVGYGATLSCPPPHIYYEDERQYAVSEFQALLKSWLRMSQNQATGDGGTCFGDSGGPAFWKDPDDLVSAEILVGITSWGDAVCVATGFNYRVDIADTLDFIGDVTDSLQP
jgi:hypothetical protein